MYAWVPMNSLEVEKLKGAQEPCLNKYSKSRTKLASLYSEICHKTGQQADFVYKLNLNNQGEFEMIERKNNNKSLTKYSHSTIICTRIGSKQPL